MFFCTKERMTIVTFITKREWGRLVQSRYGNKKPPDAVTSGKRDVAFAGKKKKGIRNIVGSKRDN